jgi:hypothetical protein
MNLYVVLKNIQTITYEWTSDKLYVEADETFWELCARGCVGRCARVVVDHVRTRDEAASYNASELWSVNWYSNLRQYLRWITLYCDDAECVETKSSDKNIVSHQIGVGTRGHELAIEINLQKRGYQLVCFFSSYRETAKSKAKNREFSTWE